MVDRRTFTALLAGASVWPMPIRQGNDVTTLPAAIVIYRIGSDGMLSFARKYDIDASTRKQQFWAGMMTLA
jgi:6-phosphogluconolactonase